MAQELSKGIEPLAKISMLDYVILLVRVGKESLVFVNGFRAKPRQFRAHPGGIFPEVQHHSILKEVAPLRINALKRDVVFKALAIALEHRAENLRQREDGWTEIKAESPGL